MNREQVKVLQANGFAFEGLPNIIPQPRATYYSCDKNTGVIVKHDLPADPYSLDHYLKKGFVLNPGDLKPQVVEEPAVQASEDKPKRKYRKHNKNKEK